MNLSQKVLQTIQQLDRKGSANEFSKKINDTVERAINNRQPLNLLCFTCSTINSEYLFSNTPWLYVNTNPTENNLGPDIVNINTAIDRLTVVYPETKLNIIIGNTDPYYIYLQQFNDFYDQRDLLWKKFIQRWSEYENNLKQWLALNIPSAKIINWYSFEKSLESSTGKSFENEFVETKQNVDLYFSNKQLQWELGKLKTQFGEGKYFKKLARPNKQLLKDWVIRKFSEYAVQGKWIYESIPNPILIQNEKPSDLRSQMYQPLIQKEYNSTLPIVYFLGVDNNDYQ